jgi:hypothetical protein
VLKSEAWRVQHPETMQNLHARIALLETFISEHTSFSSATTTKDWEGNKEKGE